jgi:hypothetical protein
MNAREPKPKKRTQKRCACGEVSIPGLVAGVALCQYHYNVRMFGKAWADKCRADKREA